MRALRQRLRRITAFATGLLLLALTAVTLVDVLGRYFFASPLAGASELTEILVMAIVFSGLPAICLDDGHITVDLFTSRLRGRAAGVQTAIARLSVAAVLALVAWQLWEHGTRLATYGETTMFLRIPLTPVAMAAAVFCGVSALLVVFLVIARLPRGKSEDI